MRKEVLLAMAILIAGISTSIIFLPEASAESTEKPSIKSFGYKEYAQMKKESAGKENTEAETAIKKEATANAPPPLPAVQPKAQSDIEKELEEQARKDFTKGKNEMLSQLDNRIEKMHAKRDCVKNAKNKQDIQNCMPNVKYRKKYSHYSQKKNGSDN